MLSHILHYLTFCISLRPPIKTENNRYLIKHFDIRKKLVTSYALRQWRPRDRRFAAKSEFTFGWMINGVWGNGGLGRIRDADTTLIVSPLAGAAAAISRATRASGVRVRVIGLRRIPRINYLHSCSLSLPPLFSFSFSLSLFLSFTLHGGIRGNRTTDLQV